MDPVKGLLVDEDLHIYTFVFAIIYRPTQRPDLHVCPRF